MNCYMDVSAEMMRKLLLIKKNDLEGITLLLESFEQKSLELFMSVIASKLTSFEFENLQYIIVNIFLGKLDFCKEKFEISEEEIDYLKGVYNDLIYIDFKDGEIEKIVSSLDKINIAILLYLINDYGDYELFDKIMEFDTKNNLLLMADFMDMVDKLNLYNDYNLEDFTKKFDIIELDVISKTMKDTFENLNHEYLDVTIDVLKKYNYKEEEFKNLMLKKMFYDSRVDFRAERTKNKIYKRK